MPVEIPEKFLRFAERNESWASWLEALPRLISDVLDEWELTPDGEVRTGQAAAVVPVRTALGESAAAKFCWPHPEAELEHLALRAWDGAGAIRLLRADPRRSVLLLEQADGARDLSTVPVIEACEIVAGLYPRLHRPAVPQLDRLSELAGIWAVELAGLRDQSLVPRRYVDQAAALARDFAADPATDGRLIHTDLHYFNVLAVPADRVQERGTGWRSIRSRCRAIPPTRSPHCCGIAGMRRSRRETCAMRSWSGSMPSSMPPGWRRSGPGTG